MSISNACNAYNYDDRLTYVVEHLIFTQHIRRAQIALNLTNLPDGALDDIHKVITTTKM